MPGLRPQVLVPTARRGRDAVAAGARFLVYVLSVSESHNRSNVRRSPAESAEDYARLLDGLPAGVEVRINLATAFDCPFEGRVPVGAALDLLGRLVALRPDVEVCLCDTTGRATPDHVAQLSAEAAASLPNVAAWAFHAHDTYGLGLATTYAAYQAGRAGVRRRRGRAGRLPLRARRHGQRGDRGRRLDVRADGDRHRRGPRRLAAGGPGSRGAAGRLRRAAARATRCSPWAGGGLRGAAGTGRRRGRRA